MNIAEGIYVTQSRQRAIELKGSVEAGYKDWVQTIEKCHGSNGWLYWWKLGNKPKKDVIYAYIIIENKVRWRARILEFTKEMTKTFLTPTPRTMHAKCWMLLYDFEKLPRPYEVKKGFQGFRYKY